jgi:3-dehydroquinate synthase
MRDLKVNLDTRSYNILIGDHPVERIGVECKKFIRGNEVWLISDKNVLKEYKTLLISCFKKLDIKLNLYEVPAGEHVKSFTFFEKVTDWLIGSGIERGDLVIAFGGGVVGDLVGFAAAVTLRGINFIQVPTTLLAQVDSSVGGKTGINSRFGKNLIGCFHQPKSMCLFILIH